MWTNFDFANQKKKKKKIQVKIFSFFSSLFIVQQAYHMSWMKVFKEATFREFDFKEAKL